MRQVAASAVFSLAICFGQVAVAAPRDDVGSIDPGGDHDPSEGQVQLPPDPEGKAVELRLAGKCGEALGILRRLADADDIANYNLGLCLIDLGKAAHDEAEQREGARWILKAANHGLPNAQSSLVSVYLDGSGVAKDAVEAGKWSLLYEQNGTRMAIGMADLPPALQSRLDGSLNEEGWAQAQDRASAWTPAARRSNDY